MPDDESQEAEDSGAQQKPIEPGFAKEALSNFPMDDWKELDLKFNALFKDLEG